MIQGKRGKKRPGKVPLRNSTLKPWYSEQVSQTLFVHYIEYFSISNVKYLVSSSSKWELGFVHYITKFTILRFVTSRFECTQHLESGLHFLVFPFWNIMIIKRPPSTLKIYGKNLGLLCLCLIIFDKFLFSAPILTNFEQHCSWEQ